MNNYLIMDGGMGTILRDKFNNNDRVLWSLKPYFTNKDHIKKAHELFLNSGADIIITNNYCATPYYLNKVNITIDKIPNIIKDIGLIGRTILNNYEDVLLFGSIPPYGESYNTIIENKSNIFKHYLTTFISLYTNVDSFIFETVSSLDEFNLILEFIEYIKINKKIINCDILKKKHRNFNNIIKKEICNKIFISFCVNYTGEEILDGTNLDFIIQRLLNNKINYIFLNCSPINYINKTIDYISKNKQIKIGVYPNKHMKTIKDFNLENEFNKEIIYSDISKEEFCKYKDKWINQNVKIIGGCCGINEEYIKILNRSKL